MVMKSKMIITIHLMRGLVIALLLVSFSTLVAPDARATPQCFTLTMSPSSATIHRGGSPVTYQILITSVGGFSGTVNVGVTGISPANSNGLLLKVRNYDNWVAANGHAGTIMTASASQATLPSTYTITMTGKDITGGICHGVTNAVNVNLTVM